MKKCLMSILLSLCVALGCEEKRTEYTKNMEATGVVKERTYTPSTTDFSVSIDMEGNTEMDFDTISEKYKVIIGWELGDFVCEGDSGRAFYERFKDNQRARLTLRKKIESVYEDIDNDNKKEQVSRSESFELVDAWPDD